jgi:hypothetical protein
LPDSSPGDSPRDRLARIQDLWDRLKRASDPKQRELLEKRLREETDAYKQATGHDFDA